MFPHRPDSSSSAIDSDDEIENLPFVRQTLGLFGQDPQVQQTRLAQNRARLSRVFEQSPLPHPDVPETAAAAPPPPYSPADQIIQELCAQNQILHERNFWEITIWLVLIILLGMCLVVIIYQAWLL